MKCFQFGVTFEKINFYRLILWTITNQANPNMKKVSTFKINTKITFSFHINSCISPDGLLQSRHDSGLLFEFAPSISDQCFNNCSDYNRVRLFKCTSDLPAKSQNDPLTNARKKSFSIETLPETLCSPC